MVVALQDTERSSSALCTCFFGFLVSSGDSPDSHEANIFEKRVKAAFETWSSSVTREEDRECCRASDDKNIGQCSRPSALTQLHGWR